MMSNAKNFEVLVCEHKQCKRHYMPFNTELELEKHRLFIHKKYKCNYCPLVCHNIYHLCKHKNTAHSENINEELAKIKSGQNLSQSSVNKEVRNYNNDCNLIHLNSTLNKLETEQKVFNDSMDGNEHHFTNGRIKCIWNGCGQQLAEEQYEQHVNNHLLNPFRCDCGKSFSEPNLLDEHKNRDHSKILESYFSNDSTSVNQLIKNTINSLNIDIDTNYKLSDVRIPDVGFVCHFYQCNQTFIDIKAFECHRIIHRDTSFINFNQLVEQSLELNSFIYKCQIKNCFVKSQRRNTVLEHISSHFGENPFKCNIKDCFQRFPNRIKCREHEISHFCEVVVPENTFKCLWPECKSQFGDKVALLYHVDVHLEMRVNCDVCGKQFRRLSHLEAHKITHNLDKYVIIDLSYHFKQTSNQIYTCEWPNCEMKIMFDEESMVKHIRQHYGIDIGAVETKSSSGSCSIDSIHSIHDVKNGFVLKPAKSLGTESKNDGSHETVSKVDESLKTDHKVNVKNLNELFKLKKCRVILIDINSKKRMATNEISSSGQPEVSCVDDKKNEISKTFNLRPFQVRLYNNNEKRKRFALNCNIFD